MPVITDAANQANLSAASKRNPVFDEDNVYVANNIGLVYRHYKKDDKSEYWDEVLVPGPCVNANGTAYTTNSGTNEWSSSLAGGAATTVAARTTLPSTSGNYGAGPYANIATVGGSGSGLTITVTVSSNEATAVAIGSTAGTGYVAGDSVVVKGSLLGGTDGTDDITVDITAASAITGTRALTPPASPVFLTGDTVQAPNPAGTILYLTVVAAGSGYAVDDTLGQTSTDGSGTGFTGVVTSVDSGELVTIAVTNAGSGYVDGEVITLSTGGSGTGATAEVSASA